MGKKTEENSESAVGEDRGKNKLEKSGVFDRSISCFLPLREKGREDFGRPAKAMCKAAKALAGF